MRFWGVAGSLPRVRTVEEIDLHFLCRQRRHQELTLLCLPLWFDTASLFRGRLVHSADCIAAFSRAKAKPGIATASATFPRSRCFFSQCFPSSAAAWRWHRLTPSEPAALPPPGRPSRPLGSSGGTRDFFVLLPSLPAVPVPRLLRRPWQMACATQPEGLKRRIL